MFESFGINAGFVEDEYHRYLENPQLVHESWRAYFDKLGGSQGGTNGNGHGNGNGNGNGHAGYAQAAQQTPFVSDGNGQSRITGAVIRQAHVSDLVNAYRQRGHYYADVNPLIEPTAKRDELDLRAF